MPVAAEELKTADVSRADCRDEGIGTEHSDNVGSSPLEPFPENDVFRPLLADLKQPQFFASYQAARVHDTNQSFNIGNVAFGENFGLVGRRNGCDGWQVGLLGGVFAQFNLSDNELINADYVIGVPVSWRSGLVSARVRVFHQSSHLGDQFLLANPEIKRISLSFEEAEAIVSLDAPGGWGRLYAGGGYLVHKVPATLDPIKVQWGLELRGPAFRSPILDLRMTPIMGADFKTFEELKWSINTNVAGGLEWHRSGRFRRFRLLVNYYHGFNPYGQFFAQKIQSVGIGVYLSF
ncbi:MAG: DUF1207 domain-containing protein [Nitrospiraceae bacterium]